MHRFFQFRAPIVFYHGLWTPDSDSFKSFGGYYLDAFAHDMRMLSRRFRFVTLDSMLQLNQSDVAPSEPVMAVCFDDGFDMLRNGALDALDELGIRATLFVMNGCVGNRHLMWMHMLGAVNHWKGSTRLVAEYNRAVAKANLGPTIESPRDLPYAALSWPMKRKDEISAEIYAASEMPRLDEFLGEHRPYMSWDDLRVWIGRGHQVGLHTRSHPFCSRLSGEEIESEIIAPARELRSRLGIGSLPFAYPFGDRLASRELEHQVYRAAEFCCMLGVEGLSKLGTEPWRLERVDAEASLDKRLYGRPVLRTIMGRASPWRGNACRHPTFRQL